MIIAVIGSRSLCLDIAPYIPANATEIITSGMPGIGMLAVHYADEHGLPKLVIKLDHLYETVQERKWRSSIIIDAADKVVAIWDGKSTGTGRAIRYARQTGKPIDVYIIDNEQKRA